jgi:L-ascorbate metabolism protein UlaG (beta-lactamase superfamily)
MRISRPRLGAALAAAWLLAAGGGRPAAAELDGDRLSSAVGEVVIHPVRHASLVIGIGKEAIYVDPVGGAALYAGLPSPTAILITHSHPDHFDVPTLEAIDKNHVVIFAPESVVDALPDALKADARSVTNGGKGRVAGIPFQAVAAYNTTPERLQYHPKGEGNGYLLQFGDKRIYIAGDTEPTPEMLALTNVDIAFLPMNLPYTMTEEQAAEAVKAFRPKIVYPYHYRGSDPAKFARLVGDAAEVRLVDWYAR